MHYAARAAGILCLLFIWSCNKTDIAPKTAPPTPSEPANTYLQLQTGHAWVYQSRNINLSASDTTHLSKLDSIYVAADTLFDRARYYIQKGTRLGSTFESILRVSGPEALDTAGQLYFSTELNKGSFNVPESLLPENVVSARGSIGEGPELATPYGTFRTKAYAMEATFVPPGDTLVQGLRFDTLFFAPEVGLVRYVQHNPEQHLKVEMELLRAYL